MIDYRYLKAFLLTASYSSFSRAALELKIAQSAVSRQIKLLEETLGTELIVRSSKKVLLTTQGKELYLAVKNFDHQAENIFKSSKSGPLRIGALHGLLEDWLTPLLPAYFKKYERPMHIEVGPISKLRQGIEAGEFDCIFSTDNIQSELLTSLKIFDETNVLISKEEINLKQLTDYRWITYVEVDHIHKLCKGPHNKIISVNSLTSIVNLVRSGVGIAVVPDHVLKKNERLFVTKLPQLKKSEVFMTTLNTQHLPLHLQELLELINLEEKKFGDN